MSQPASTLKTNEEWEGFIKKELLNFMILHNLQKVTAEDGAGKKGYVKIDKNGGYDTNYSIKELL